MDPRRREGVGRGTVLGAVTAFAGVAALATAAWGQDQYIQFEPLAYRGSPEGEPLEGQDGWYLAGSGGGGGGEWLVYTFDGGTLGVPSSTSGGRQFVAVTTLGDVPAQIERGARFDWDMIFAIDVLVEHPGPLPAPEEIGRISLEPADLRSTFELVMRWEDAGAADRWVLEMVHYTAAGERVQSRFPGSSLAPGEWYEIFVHAGFDSNRIFSGSVTEKSSGRRLAGFTSSDWYMAGGASALGLPSAVRLTAGDGTGGGVVVAADNLFTGSYFLCYTDCDRDRDFTFFDLLCFQTLFAAGDPYADCDGSGVLEFFDFLCFQTEFGSCGP